MTRSERVCRLCIVRELSDEDAMNFVLAKLYEHRSNAEVVVMLRAALNAINERVKL